MGAENNLIRDFERENKISLDVEKQVKQEKREKEWNLELWKKFGVSVEKLKIFWYNL